MPDLTRFGKEWPAVAETRMPGLAATGQIFMAGQEKPLANLEI